MDLRVTLEAAGREEDYRRAVVEVAKLLALPETAAARNVAAYVSIREEPFVDEVQLNAAHQDGSYSNERERLGRTFETRVHDRPLVPAEQPWHP